MTNLVHSNGSSSQTNEMIGVTLVRICVLKNNAIIEFSRADQYQSRKYNFAAVCALIPTLLHVDPPILMIKLSPKMSFKHQEIMKINNFT